MQTDTQTDVLITILHTPPEGKVIIPLPAMYTLKAAYCTVCYQMPAVCQRESHLVVEANCAPSVAHRQHL